MYDAFVRQGISRNCRHKSLKTFCRSKHPTVGTKPCLMAHGHHRTLVLFLLWPGRGVWLEMVGKQSQLWEMLLTNSLIHSLVMFSWLIVDQYLICKPNSQLWLFYTMLKECLKMGSTGCVDTNDIGHIWPLQLVTCNRWAFQEIMRDYLKWLWWNKSTDPQSPPMTGGRRWSLGLEHFDMLSINCVSANTTGKSWGSRMARWAMC